LYRRTEQTCDEACRRDYVIRVRAAVDGRHHAMELQRTRRHE
jgi:hypothetical protein